MINSDLNGRSCVYRTTVVNCHGTRMVKCVCARVLYVRAHVCEPLFSGLCSSLAVVAPLRLPADTCTEAVRSNLTVIPSVRVCLSVPPSKREAPNQRRILIIIIIMADQGESPAPVHHPQPALTTSWPITRESYELQEVIGQQPGMVMKAAYYHGKACRGGLSAVNDDEGLPAFFHMLQPPAMLCNADVNQHIQRLPVYSNYAEPNQLKLQVSARG